MGINVRKLGHALGAEVSGVDLNDRCCVTPAGGAARAIRPKAMLTGDRVDSTRFSKACGVLLISPKNRSFAAIAVRHRHRDCFLVHIQPRILDKLFDDLPCPLRLCVWGFGQASSFIRVC